MKTPEIYPTNDQQVGSKIDQLSFAARVFPNWEE